MLLARLIIALSPRHTLVSRYADVLEVLRHDDVFSVQEYGRRMEETVGRFFLGTDASANGEYGGQWNLARQALYVTDDDERGGFAADVREAANHLARAEIDEHRGSGKIDAVADLARVVPIKLVEQLFGIRDTDPPSIFDNCLTFSQYIFFGWPFIPRYLLRGKAIVAGGQFRSEVGRQVTDRINSGDPRPDVLGRLIRAQGDPPDPEVTRNIMIGLVSGATVAAGMLFASMADRMMDFPADWLQRLQSAAARATRSGSGDEELTRFVREAARFAPQPPYPYRYSKQEYVIAKGTEREKRIPPGKIVVLSITGAGADGHFHQDPELFRLDRPEEAYLLFGYGLHACVGRFIGEIILEEMTAALFSLPQLRRARRHGRLPSALRTPRLVLEFAPARNGA